MSPPDRSKGEFRSAEHDGSSMSPPDRSKGEFRSAEHAEHDGAPAFASADDQSADALAAEACAREPIHIPGSIQPHGALAVLDPADFRLLQASANLHALLKLDAGLAPERFVDALPALRALLVDWLAGDPDSPLQSQLTSPHEGAQVSGHRGAQGLVLEFEPFVTGERHTLDMLYPQLRRFVDRVETEDDMAALGHLAAQEVRALTGFDRVLVYRFDADWHGTVIAEDGNGRLPSYLDLRFPASDIPAQARELYRRSRLRMIPDAHYVPVPVLPALSPLDAQPLDLSSAALRSVSPVHVQYMRNMGTGASMSVSIVIDGRLWGLVSCHHAGARRVGPPTRAACDFLGQILALKIGSHERGQDAALRLAARELQAELLERITRVATQPEDLNQALASLPDAWLRLARARGVAIVREDEVETAGRTPAPAALRALAAWLHGRQGVAAQSGEAFVSHALARAYPPAQAFADSACGLIAVPISALHPHYAMWFRPELIHTVTWGGMPTKALEPGVKLEPRRSFAQWTEEVRGEAQRWSAVEVDSAVSFRNALVNVVLKQAEERAALSERLATSNRELEAFSYSVSHDLRAPFRHIVGYAQLLADNETALAPRSRHYLDTIIESALSAGRLVDDLLNFSQLGRASLDMTRVDMNKIVHEIRQSTRIDEGDRQIAWSVEPLVPAFGDASLLRQAIANLIDNAIKYTREEQQAEIRIASEDRAHETVYTVADNGVGFDMTYVGKLFGVFQRLHRVEDFEGSGIGLALARRIVDRHGGWIAAEGELGRGATFRFGIPKQQQRIAESRP